jgi:hypothetical protein
VAKEHANRQTLQDTWQKLRRHLEMLRGEG